MCWEEVLSRRVLSVIESRNYNRWPKALDEWVDVYTRSGIYMNIGPIGTFIYEMAGVRVAFVKATEDRQRLYASLAHELAEHLLRTEVESPFRYLPGTENHYHRIACYVEMHCKQVVH